MHGLQAAGLLLMASEATHSSRTVWSPHPGSQALFLSCPIFECLYEGTRGPGKTDALLMDFAQHVGQGFGADWRGILFRRTYKQLADVEAKSRRWFSQIFPGASYNGSEHVWTWPGGEALLLRYMDKAEDYWQYHGHEYPWIGWEELTNWPDLTAYHSMKSCCRSSRAGMPRKYRATCNPYGRGHNAVKAYFVDPAPAGVPFAPPRPELPEGVAMPEGEALQAVRLSGHYSENRTLLAADPSYPQKIAAAAENPEQAKAWLNGSWDIMAGGMVDDVWRRGIHVLKPFPIPASWRVDRSFDWGSSKPFSVGWWAESDGTEAILADGTRRAWPRGTLFRIAEWYGCREGAPNEGLKMLAVEIADGIKERERGMIWGPRVRPGPADSSIFDVENGRCIADDMADKGVKWERADKSPGSRKTGAEEVRKRLKAALVHPMEEPGLFVFDGCRHWLRTVPTIPRDERNLDDVDTEAEDHCFVGETKVLTPDGVRRLDSLPERGVIRTDQGWRAYEGLRCTRRGAPVVRVSLEGGASEVCTPDHRWLTPAGWSTADQLDDTRYVIIDQWPDRASSQRPSKSSRGRGTIAAGSISAATSRKAGGSIYTGPCGERSTERYPWVATFTTATGTPATTIRRTLNYSRRPSTSAGSTAARLVTGCAPAGMLRLARRPSGGTHRLPGVGGMENTPATFTGALTLACEIANTADNASLSPPSCTRVFSGSAPITANPLRAELAALTTRVAHAKAAGPGFGATSTSGPATVRAVVLRVEPAGLADVWCLNVPSLGRFSLASGPIVHNCWDETRYRARFTPSRGYAVRLR